MKWHTVAPLLFSLASARAFVIPGAPYTKLRTFASLESLTVPELKVRLREHGLSVSGRKAELVQRLLEINTDLASSADAGPVIEPKFGEPIADGTRSVMILACKS